jgi:hypothetical protein
MTAMPAKERVTDGYSYATVSAALGGVFGAGAAVRKGAFRGRLQHLRRLGLPSSGPGRGRTLAYSDEVVCAMLIALELEEFGIDPAMAVRMVTGKVGPDREGMKNYLPEVVERARGSLGGDDDIVLAVDPCFMSAAWGSPEMRSGAFDPAAFHDVRFGKMKEFLDFWLRWHRPRRFSIFNLSERLRQLDVAIKAVQEESKAS